MRILGIETSCDETAAAIVEDGTKILASTLASSQTLHQKTGGIIPEVAAREQIKCIIPVINEALKNSYLVARATSSPPRSESSGQAMKQWNPKERLPCAGGFQPRAHKERVFGAGNEMVKNIDAIAVTIGPGLIGSLLVGVETAKTIAYITKKPIVPVNHIFAHIYANFLQRKSGSDLDKKGLTLSINTHIQFPAIALVVSGGHTELFLMKDHGNLKWLGGTRDDAAGETFDKTARLLGLGYPGGPAIAAEAAKLRTKPACRNLELRTKNNIKLPRPMIDEDNLDFSFSGLKTAVVKEINKLKTMKQWNNETPKNAYPATAGSASTGQAIQQLAYEIQESITDVLVEKTIQAAKQYKVKSILLGGGVAANQRLKEKFRSQLTTHNLQLFIPPPHLCTDNAAYIASYAYFNYHPVPWKKIQAQPNLEVEV